MVHQEPSGFPQLDVAWNVVAGTEPSRAGLVRRAEARRAARAALELLGGAARDLPLDAPLAALAPAEQQLVEIARALRQASARVLILDEPTSSLGPREVERLFEIVARLCAGGTTVLYISHQLPEVQRIATRFTVLRDGRVAASGAVAATSVDQLARAMSGAGARPGQAQAQARAPRDGARGAPVLHLEHLVGAPLPVDATLTLHAGEVLGIAGLMGAGRTELLRAVFGLDEVRSGAVEVAGVVGRASPARRIAQGLGMLSEDRAGEGLALGLTLAENLTLSRPPTGRVRGLLSPRRERLAFLRWSRRLGVRGGGADRRAAVLSGGNQQKIALARLLHQRAAVLLLDEPTRGIDIGSKAEIHRLVGDLARAGKAVLLVSSDLAELRATCDRIAVMHRGRLGPARPAAELDEQALLLEAAGATPETRP
jgi:ribose transport system ATP-binding protein